MMWCNALAMKSIEQQRAEKGAGKEKAKSKSDSQASIHNRNPNSPSPGPSPGNPKVWSKYIEVQAPWRAKPEG